MIKLGREVQPGLLKGFEDMVNNPDSIYLRIQDDGKIVGLYEVQMFTKITGNVHVRLLPEARNTGISKDAYPALLEYLKANTHLKKLICSIPAKHEPMMKIINKTRFKACGLIPDGIFWNDETQDLILFQLDI